MVVFSVFAFGGGQWLQQYPATLDAEMRLAGWLTVNLQNKCGQLDANCAENKKGIGNSADPCRIGTDLI